jgi:hypothetical protein
MTQSYIAQWLRDRVAETARHRFGYCLSAESVVGTRMEMDHILPRSAGGLTEEDNLWLACSLWASQVSCSSLPPRSSATGRKWN